MKRNNLIRAALAAVAIMLAGCGSSKKASSTGQAIPAEKSIISSIAEAQKDWTTMQCSGKVSLQAGSSLSSSMQMKMKRGESIFISLRPILGIEVAKMIVDNGKVVFIDKMHKKYVEEDMSLLTGGLEIDMTTLQDIFLGRSFILGKGTVTDKMADELDIQTASGIRITPLKQNRMFLYSFGYDNNGNITYLTVNIGSMEKAYSVAYGDVQTTTAGKVATYANISTVISNTPLSLELSYRSLDWNQNLTIDASVPSGYAKVEFADFVESLKQ